MKWFRRLQRRRALLTTGIATGGLLTVGLLVGPLHDALWSSKPSGQAAPQAGGSTTVRPVGPTILVIPKRRPTQPSGSGHVGAGSASQSSADFVPGQLLVKFRDGTTPQTARRLLNRVDGDAEGEVGKIDVQVVSVPDANAAASVRALDASPAVEYVERDAAVTAFDVRPNDPLWPNQWGAVAIKLPAAWTATTGSSRVVIAVLDTGVDPAHPDLRGALVAGRNFIDDNDDTSDQNGHGTATAGLVGARTNNATAVAGVCWICTVMPVKVLNAANKGTTATLAAGIVWAADHGARVINMSVGASSSTQTLADAIDYAAAKGIVLVAAAGNNGSADPAYPAAYPQVLSVSGTTAAGALYSWSSYGSWVNLAAPGCNAAPWLNGANVNFCGTSSATPLVAGIAGLILSAKPAASRSDVAWAIERTATPLPGSVQFGFVNASAALALLGIRPHAQTVTAR